MTYRFAGQDESDRLAGHHRNVEHRKDGAVVLEALVVQCLPDRNEVVAWRHVSRS
jgi:hypothetical protein